MDFTKYAVEETSDLVGRLVAGASDKVAGDLQALRQAFDLVTVALDTALAAPSTDEYRDQVAALAGRLAAEAAKQAEAAAGQVRSEAQTAIDDLRSKLEAQTSRAEEARTACAKAEEAHDRVEAARADAVEQARRQTEALEQAAAEADALKGEITAVREQLEAARAESLRVSAQRDADAAQSEKMAAALSAITTEMQDAKTQGKKLLAEVKAAAGEVEALKQANVEHDRNGRALQTKLDEARAEATSSAQRAAAAETEVGSLRKQVESAAQAKEQSARAVEEAEARAGRLLAEQADTIRKHAGSFMSSSVDRLLAMYLRAAKGATLDEVLGSIVDALTAQFPRVAVFRVQSNRLEGVRQVGFDVKGDISQVLIPRTRDSLITQAIASANIETRSGSELTDTSGMPFGGTPQFGLAVPFVVEGECLAVAYADDSGNQDGEFARRELREKFARLLQCQAVPLLARLAAEAKALAELDEYAALLLTELEQTHAAEVAAGAPDGERRRNLKENIEYARRMYAQRAAPEGQRAAALFERRLFAAVEARADTAFCSDIVAVVGGRKRAARAAEAARAAGQA